jgi:putative addiction module component (TIGR02574 family)
MSDPISDLSARAKELPPEARARLAEDLLASLDPKVSDVEAAWSDEFRRRIAEVERGAVELVAGADAFSQVRKALER